MAVKVLNRGNDQVDTNISMHHAQPVFKVSAIHSTDGLQGGTNRKYSIASAHSLMAAGTLQLTWSTILVAIFQWGICTNPDFDVIILGAGPAGLSTAHHLLDTNLSVALLDKDRVGGRVKTLQYGLFGVDLGPAWIHYGTANPLTFLAKQGNCSLVRTQNLNMDVYHAGKVVPRAVVANMFRLLDLVEDGYAQWKNSDNARKQDVSLLHVLQQILHSKELHLNQDEQAAFAAILFGEVVEDWTAPLNQLSAIKHCEYDTADGVGSDWRVIEGMECVLKAMTPDESSLRTMLHLEHKVQSVALDAGRVVVHGDGWQLSSRAGVVALPLGELRESRVTIDPLPHWKQTAWKQLGLGQAIRAALQFEYSFWPPHVEFFMDFITNCTANFLEDVDLCSIEFIAPVRGSQAPVLVAEADGRLAEQLSSKSDKAVVDFLVSRLHDMFGRLPVLKWASVTRPWGLPFWHTKSRGRESARAAGKPLGNLFFAGDYVSHNVGTVAGAYLSGIAAAHAIRCHLGLPGLELEEHPAVAPMILPKCAKKLIRGVHRHNRCNLTLWDILYACSSLPELEDESGRTCFVQGRDKWQDSLGWRWAQHLYLVAKQAFQSLRAFWEPQGMQEL